MICGAIFSDEDLDGPEGDMAWETSWTEGSEGDVCFRGDIRERSTPPLLVGRGPAGQGEGENPHLVL